MRSSLKTAALVAAAIVGLSSSTALADHGRYEMKRIYGGPRADRYVFVRTAEHRERPYALTGHERARPARQHADWPMRLHLKGPRGNY